MNDTVNIGIKFLEKIGAALKFRKGNTLIIGDDHTPMIKSMKSLLEQPALKETDKNPDDKNLDSNDDENLEDNNNGDEDGHGEDDEGTFPGDTLDKDINLGRHSRNHEPRNPYNMRKPGKHWLVYAKACTAVPPITTRMVEVEIKGFPGTDPEQLNKREVLFEKRKQGGEPVAVYVWKPQGMKIVVTNHEQDAKFVGAGQLLGKISLLESTLPTETITSDGQPRSKGVANPEEKGKPEDGPKSHGLKEMSSRQKASDFKERLDAIYKELEVDNNKILNGHPEAKAKVKSILEEYMDVFAEPGQDIGETDLIEFNIELTEDAKPYKVRIHPLNPKQRGELRAQLYQWLEQRII